MSRRRYEILLPIRYNDGASVEPERFFQTQEELIAEFGALTSSPELFRGVWIHEGQRFEDQSLRLVVDVEATPESRAFFREFKERLKDRFCQVDIWIVSYEIEVI
jgi:spore coat polysaccharide biosynthesis protein SpsF (cytidylyltransferase family)